MEGSAPASGLGCLLEAKGILPSQLRVTLKEKDSGLVVGLHLSVPITMGEGWCSLVGGTAWGIWYG